MPDVDEFEMVADLDDPSPVADPSPRRRRRSWHARPATWVAAAVVLVVVGASTTSPVPLVLGRGQGVSFNISELDLAAPPAIVWQVPVGSASPYTHIDQTVVLMAFNSPQGQLVGLDMADGAELWQYEDGSSCQGGPTSLACVERSATPEATVVLIDAADGAQQRIDWPGAVAAAPVEGGVVLAELTLLDGATDDGSASAADYVEAVVRVAADGTPLWRTEAESVDTTSFPAWTYLTVTDTQVQPATSLEALNLETGAVEPAVNAYASADEAWSIEYRDDGSGVVHTAAGDVELAADEALPPYDDDLGGPISFHLTGAEGDEISARWRGNGVELWSLPGGCYPQARLSGVMLAGCYSSTSIRFVAVSELTGETLWENPELGWLLFVNASTVVAFDQRSEQLLAVDVRTGEIVWSMPIEGGGNGAMLNLSDGIVVATTTHIVRFAWD